MIQAQHYTSEAEMRESYKDVRARLSKASSGPNELSKLKAIAEGQRKQIQLLTEENSRLAIDCKQLMQEHARIMDAFHGYVGEITGCQKQRRVLKR